MLNNDYCMFSQSEFCVWGGVCLLVHHKLPLYPPCRFYYNNDSIIPHNHILCLFYPNLNLTT